MSYKKIDLGKAAGVIEKNLPGVLNGTATKIEAATNVETGITNSSSKIDLQLFADGSSNATGKTYIVNGEVLTVNQFAALRQKAVNQAWKQEKELIETTGKGTREWTEVEKQELLTTGKVKGYEGQHMKSAEAYPDQAGDRTTYNS